MSGHSKWSTIKHKKAANDKVKGSVFTKMAKAITIAVKKGGNVGDVDMNFALRLAVDKARSVNMPKDNIDRAIAKGMGKSEGEELAELLIEAFGPEGVVVMIEIVTDSRNRVVSEMRNLIEKHGGRMGEPGSVAYLFDQTGIVRIEGNLTEEEQLAAIDAGLSDYVEGEESALYGSIDAIKPLVQFVEGLGKKVVEAGKGYRPKTVVQPEGMEAVENLLNAISDYEEVQEVYVNLA